MNRPGKLLASINRLFDKYRIYIDFYIYKNRITLAHHSEGLGNVFFLYFFDSFSIRLK